MNDEWNDWKKRGTDAAPLHRSFIALVSLFLRSSYAPSVVIPFLHVA